MNFVAMFLRYFFSCFALFWFDCFVVVVVVFFILLLLLLLLFY